MRPRLLLLLAFLAPATAAAQGWVIPRPCPLECRTGGCLPRCGPTVGPTRVVRTGSDVRVALADGVLRYEVTETFVNRGAGLGEADYLFPLPAGAALQDLRLSIDGKLVAGETLGAEEARRVYEDIVRTQRDPALVEWMGRGLLRARIFPLPPGESRRVVVRFQQVAVREGDALRVDYFRGTPPGGAAEGRAAARDDRARDDRARDDDPEPETRDGFVLTYPATTEYGEPYSPTHEVRVRRDGDVRRATVRGATGEVTLLVPVRRADEASITVLPYAAGDDERFALVTVSLPERSARRTPRDVTLVLDVSGSMSGRKIEQARDAGKQLLRTLRRDDRFRIVDFSSDVRAFPERETREDGDFALASDANVRAAERYLDALDATGGTNIEGALREAMRPRAAAGRLSLVLFVTDGEPTVGERRPDALADSARAWRAARRLFTFGLGADVNSALVEQLALEGRGTAQFVRPAESVERAVSVVALRLADPVATDVRVRVDGGVRLAQAMPNGPVDVFAGQDLVLLARYDGSGTARVRVEGRTAFGPATWSSEARFPGRERGNAFVPRLWATQRVGWLSAELRRSGASAEIEAEIRALGERYGIPTPYTSYLVREPVTVAGVIRDRLGSGAQREAMARAVGPAPASAPAAVDLAASGARQSAASAARDRDASFEAARKAAELRSARTVAAADSAAAGGWAGGATRRVGTRSFALVDGVWTDVRLTTTPAPARVVRVRSYSSAYFALLRALPELRDALALGERVRVAGRAAAVEVGPEGAESLPASEIAALARAW